MKKEDLKRLEKESNVALKVETEIVYFGYMVAVILSA